MAWQVSLGAARVFCGAVGELERAAALRREWEAVGGQLPTPLNTPPPVDSASMELANRLSLNTVKRAEDKPLVNTSANWRELGTCKT
jgi:hypothetical protein